MITAGSTEQSTLPKCLGEDVCPAGWGWWVIINLKSIPAMHNIDNATVKGCTLRRHLSDSRLPNVDLIEPGDEAP
jgi:hypothetical protein